MPIFASNFASNSLSGSVRVTNGFANITLATIPYALEGDKSFVIKIRKDSITGEVLSVTPTLNFRENGAFVDFSANTATVSEGGLVSFTVTTANVTNGANLFYSIFPVTANVTADDFTANTGSFTITNNAGTFALQARADTSLVDETGETFRLQLRSTNSAGNIIYTTANIVILDTFKTYNILSFAPTLGGFSVLESSNIAFTFSATNVPFGTTLYYDTTGNATVTANTGSFVLNSLSNTFTLVGGTVAVGQTNAFVVNLRTGSGSGPIVATSNTVYVLDTALASMNATGGNFVYTVYDPLTNTGTRVHKFLSSNNFTITRAGSSPTYANIEILMVAGGGSGGVTEYPGSPPGGIGGGGAGGLLYYGTKTVKTANGPLLTTNISSTYAIVIGAGGAGANAGSNTTFLINSNVVYRAVGGGGGTFGINGGSGGGPGGAGISGQGNPGGPSSSQYAGAGGGGAGGAGSSGITRAWPSYPAFPEGVAGSGGSGLGYDIEGIQQGNSGQPSTTYYAGGGGGGTQTGASAGSIGASGGVGGGGATATPGTSGTGGGGGGGYSATGGSGVVLIAYPYFPLPEYVSLTSNTAFASVTEGNEVYFTLRTNFLSNNTLLYYSTLGNVDASHFISGNTGLFRTTMNSTTFSLKSNTTIPTNEERFFQVQVRDDAGTTSNALITSSGNISSTVTILDTALAPPLVEILMVAGGGSGGYSSMSSGGGAGGLLYYGANTTPKTPNGGAIQTAKGTYTITVGAGAPAPAGYDQIGATYGGNSFISFNSNAFLLAVGGGYGNGQNAGGPGGSGGGGGYGNGNDRPAGTGFTGQGNPGAPGTGNPFNAQGRGGGGGGAGAAGSGGFGGNGLAYDITGQYTAYAGGGGGSGNTPYPSYFNGPGGVGGGGQGYQNQVANAGNGGNGGTNTGGGGGAGYGGGSGGSGIVVLRYPTASANAVSTSGNPNVIIDANYRIYKFTSSGTITF